MTSYMYSSGQKKVAVSVPFRNRSTEIKRPRERALNTHNKGMYLKRKLLLHAPAGTPFKFVHDCTARANGLRKHYSTAVKLLLNFAPVWVFKLVHLSINNTTLKGSSKPLHHPHSSLKGSSRLLQHHSQQLHRDDPQNSLGYQQQNQQWYTVVSG